MAFLIVLTGISLSTTLTGCFFEEDRGGGGGGRGYGRGYEHGGEHGRGEYEHREWR